jgi:hypothetical protein
VPGVIMPRVTGSAIAAIALALISSGISRGARAEDEAGDRLPRGARFGVLPGAGVGVAGFTNGPSEVPSFVGTTFTQIELVGETPRIGIFARGMFYSSGEAGRWTAPALALGASYRFFGDGETHLSLVGRGGLIYERWHAAEENGCSIPLFRPENCKDFTPPTLPGHTPDPSAARYHTTIDTAGILAGLRLELPVQPIFMAFGGELVSVVDFTSSSPGMIIQAQLSFTISFRSHESKDAPIVAPSSTEPAKYNERNR